MRKPSALLGALLVLLMLPVGAAAADPGDEPGTAIPVTAGVTRGDSTTMTSNPAVDPASCGEFEGFSNTMWFAYTPAKSGLTLVDLNSFVSDDGSTDFLAILFVYAKAANGSLTLVACSAYPATVTFSASAGTTYLILSAALDADDTGEPELSDHGGTFDLAITAVRGRVISDRFHNADTFVDECLSDECGTEVTVSFDDRGMSKTFFTASSQRMFTFFIVGSTTFSDADSSVTLSYAQTYRDNLTGKQTIVGLAQKIVVDGKVYSLDVGRIVFDYDGNILFEAGTHELLQPERPHLRAARLAEAAVVVVGSAGAAPDQISGTKTGPRAGFRCRPVILETIASASGTPGGPWRALASAYHRAVAGEQRLIGESIVVQSAAQGRLEEFFRNRSKGGLTITCEGGKWSARAEAAMGAVGSTGRWTTTITVAGGKYAGADDAIERACLDVIDRLAEVGLTVP